MWFYHLNNLHTDNLTAVFLYRKGAEIIKISLCKPFYFETNIRYPLTPNR